MIFINNEQPVTYDCDDTLILWDENYTQPGEGKARVVCPYDGAVTFHKPHKEHINLMKKHKARGKGIVVWSQGGAEWAKAVVEALELEEYVDLVMAKPTAHVDDLPCEAWMGSRIYIDHSKKEIEDEED